MNAHRGENQGHSFYHAWLTGLLNGPDTFLFSEWVLSAFLRIVTHPKIYKTPTPLPTALDFVAQIRRCPFAINIMPGRRHWTIFETLIRRTNASGNLMPDAYLAAAMTSRAGRILSWPHSGFSTHAAVRAENRDEAGRLGRYMIRCPLVLDRLNWSV